MSDTHRLKEDCDLRRLVAQDLGPAPLHGGRAHLWKCPFHHERRGFSLAVWPDGYRCFGACDTRGDALDWLRQYRHLSFTDALRVLGEPQPELPPAEHSHLKGASEPPDGEWQERAARVVSLAEDTLWSTEGEPALDYLLERGLTTATIRDARLGYIPGDFREWRSLEGLEVPCGITIPWFSADALWAVKVRRAYGDPKYVQIAGGSAHGLFNADVLADHRVALFCEGEFDTLLVQQEAGSLIAPVTLGSATARMTARWYSALVGQERIFVAYDRDEAGKKATQRLLRLSPRFRELRVPHDKDITEFYLQGGDVYAWVAAASGEMQPLLEGNPDGE
ncbi:MAG: toprim domain-containing protein [Anaerolineae bacterium]|nr:toprim domain-containing protein [Anaerolineae bacterium]